MNDIKLYNTLSRSKEVFKPLKKGEVGIYNCGPTVYGRAHIGNLRSYFFADILRRVLEFNSYKVRQVINITDVGHLTSDADEGEDKMTKALKNEGKALTLQNMKDVGTKYFDLFKRDLEAMNIEMPEQFPRASENINEDIELVQILFDKGIAYLTSDGVYFDTSLFKGYGKLGQIDIGGQKDGLRLPTNREKKNPIDFALWKFNKDLGWDSPWGKGFPGWHIECSAMSRKYLGQPFDIHTGGMDHIPVHHNNEIAQSEAAYDSPLANYWLHNEFVTIGDGKMAKSKGNFYTLETLKEESISPLSYRYWLLTAHYRSPVNFTYEAVHAAQNALVRLLAVVGDYPEGGSVIPSYVEQFRLIINDDLDTPQAVALMWEMLKGPAFSAADKRATVLDFDRVFGLNLSAAPRIAEEPMPPEIQALAEAREAARANKDWKKSDALRDEIESRGYEVTDTEEGYRLRAK